MLRLGLDLRLAFSDLLPPFLWQHAAPHPRMNDFKPNMSELALTVAILSSLC